jgi:hypothetical protein
MQKERIIDHEKDSYREDVIDPKTGEMVHHCEEPLNQHRGHGDDRVRKKDSYAMRNKRSHMPIGLRLSKEDEDYIKRAARREKELREPDVVGVLVYRLFDAVKGSTEPESHCVLDGGIAPADWPGWNIYAPPLGRGCFCALIGITAGRARRMIDSNEGFDLTKRVPERAGPDEGWERARGWWESI